MDSPVIIGGNGHSGTRLFAEILAVAQVRMGIKSVTRSITSYDLNIRGLLSRWVGPYIRSELTAVQRATMSRRFRLRLRAYFPIRNALWGFKNPRSMLLLPFYDEIFPGFRFVHVIRDGRDVTLGNELAGNAEYVSAYVTSDEPFTTPEERMVTFWGRSNAAAEDYGLSAMGDRYLRIRFEDLCSAPATFVPRLLAFAGADLRHVDAACARVQKPSTIGRWKQFPPEIVEKVQVAGRQWLVRFGYEIGSV